MGLTQYEENIILSGKEFEKRERFWLGKLQGEIAISAFPAVSTPAVTWSYQGGFVTYQLKTEILEKLVSISKNSPYGMFVILVTAFEYLLFRYTGNEDIIIGMPVIKSNTLTNYLNNIVLLRSAIDENAHFQRLVVRGTQYGYGSR